jgi:hypothetical protein
VPVLESYPDALAVIRALQGGIPDVLRDTIVGLYLTGSLSYGGFDPGSSDIDFLALCHQRPSADEIAADEGGPQHALARSPRAGSRLSE